MEVWAVLESNGTHNSSFQYLVVGGFQRLYYTNHEFENRTFVWVRLIFFLFGEFDFVRLPNSVELNPWIEFSMVKPSGSKQDDKPYALCPLLPRRVQSIPLSASSTQLMWELVAGNRTAHDMRWAAGSALIADRCACKFWTSVRVLHLLLLLLKFYYFVGCRLTFSTFVGGR